MRALPLLASLAGLLVLLGGPVTAAAQPADCAAAPQPAQTIPLLLDLKGLPGVPRGVNGQVYAEVPAAPGGTVCEAPPPPPAAADALRGEPGDLLQGGEGDLLRGPGQARVEITLPSNPPLRQ